MKKIWILLPVAMFCLQVAVAHAQGGVVENGCTDSPENPTAVLALVGSLGAATALLRARWAGRKSRK